MHIKNVANARSKKAKNSIPLLLEATQEENCSRSLLARNPHQAEFVHACSRLAQLWCSPQRFVVLLVRKIDAS